MIFLFAMPIAFSMCREDHDALPPITMEGKNTFGCIVDGKVWVPQGRMGQSSNHAEIQFSGDTITVNLYASGAESGFIISIHDVPDLKTGKTYDLAAGKYYASYQKWGSGISCEYKSIINGRVTLSRFDRTNNIIAGSFEFTARSTVCNESISVAEGRFDIAEIFY